MMRPNNPVETAEELGCVAAFVESGDVTHLLVLADHCQETGRGHYERMLREVAAAVTATGLPSRDWLPAVHWFLSNGSSYSYGAVSTPTQGRIRRAAANAWCEAWGLERIRENKLRVTWDHDDEQPFEPTDHDGPMWQCVVDEWTLLDHEVEHPHYGWLPADSLGGIDLGQGLQDDHGPDDTRHRYKDGSTPTYCRQVEAELFLSIMVRRGIPLPASLEPEVWSEKKTHKDDACVFRTMTRGGQTFALFPEVPAGIPEAKCCLYYSVNGDGRLTEGAVYYPGMLRHSVGADAERVLILSNAMTKAGVSWRWVERAPHKYRKKYDERAKQRPISG